MISKKTKNNSIEQHLIDLFRFQNSDIKLIDKICKYFTWFSKYSFGEGLKKIIHRLYFLRNTSNITKNLKLIGKKMKFKVTERDY